MPAGGYPYLAHHLIDQGAAAGADAPALSFRDETLSYAQLGVAVARFAAGLRAAGLRRGDRVAVFLEKRVETAVAMFGTFAAGGILVPVNPVLLPTQVGHILGDCGARFLFASQERREKLAADAAVLAGVERVVEAGAGWEGFAAEPVGTPEPALTDLDSAAIFYTSGSTGRPKGVVVSHRNLVVGAHSVNAYLGNGPDDSILSVLPLSFDAGFSQLTTGFAAGAHVVLANYLLPSGVVNLCAEHGITAITGVPPLWVQLAEQEWPAAATASLRYFASTGGRMPKTTLSRLREVFPAADPYLMYGLTEAFRSTYLDPREVDRRPDSIGRAIPNAEIVVAREDGSRCEPGEPGELVHRGALVSLGYWNDPEATAERFRPAPGRDGSICVGEPSVWSGDLVVEDEEGFLTFVGRRDEMIKTSGYRVSPTEIEEAAYETGLVRDAVALGLDDPRVGQRVVLVAGAVAGEAGIDETSVLAAMRGLLPRFMLPAQVVVWDELPRSPNGKLDRTAIRDRLAER